MYITAAIKEPTGRHTGRPASGRVHRPPVDARARKAQSQEGKGDSGHIDSHQDSPAAPDLILDRHLRVQNKGPKATLATHRKADGLRRVQA